MDLFTIGMARSKTSGGAADYHICSSSEYSSVTGLPIVSNPVPNRLYLVPINEGSGNNHYNEYYYKNGNWELFGNGTKQIEFDSSPIEGSENAVTSGGVHSALSGISDDLTELEVRVNNTISAVGSPLIATTAADMTNIDKVYVYQGEETGYTAGNWYYYNGTSWASGGVYNATAVSTDKTLSVENSAADAKVVGDSLNNLINVSTTQPSGSDNRLWINPNDNDTIEIPTQQEMVQFETSVESNVNGLSGSFAPRFDDATAYTTGDYVVNGGVLYKFKANHAAGAWTGNDVTAVKVMDEVDNLKDDFEQTTGTEPIEFTPNAYVSTAGSVGDTLTLEATENSSWWYAIVNCSEGNSFLLNLKGGNTPRAWCFVDSANKILSNAVNSVTAEKLLLIAPKDANKLILNDNNKGAKTSYKEPVKAMYNRFRAAESEIGKIDNFIDNVSESSELSISGSGIKYLEFHVVNGANYTVINNTDKICSVKTGNTNTGDTIQTVSEGLNPDSSTMFKASANANYLRFYFSSSASGSVKVINNAKLFTHLNEYFAGKNLVTLGDSIFGNNASTGTGVGDYIARITGMNVKNAAFGGTRMVKRSSNITAAFCAFDFENLIDAIVSNDFSAQEQSIQTYSASYGEYYSDRLDVLKNIDWSKVDVVTINYGTNDWAAGTDGAEYVDVYKESIGKLLTEYPNVKVFVITPAFRFWTDANDNIVDDSNTRKYGTPSVNLPEFNYNVYVVGDELSIPVIDAYNIGINRNNVWIYFATYDTTHHKEHGREFLGENIARQILSSNTGKLDTLRINEAKDIGDNAIKLIKKGENNSNSLWDSGDIYAISGNNYNNPKRIRTKTYISDDIKSAIIMDANYKFTVLGFDMTDGTCKGFLQPNILDSFNTVDRTFYTVDFQKLRSKYPNYKYRLTLRRMDDENITTDESIALVFENFVRPVNFIARRPMLTFVDDDGDYESGEIWESIVDQMNIPVTMALTTGTVGTGRKMPWSTIERLNNKGFEFVSHSHMHINLSDEFSDQVLKEDFEATISALNSHNCESKFYIYHYNPGVAIPDLNIEYVKKYFCMGINESRVLNLPYTDRTAISRYNLNKSPMKKEDIVVDGQTINAYPYKTFNDMKEIIDNVVANNGWAIFMSHLRNTYQSDGFYYNDAVGDMIMQSCKYAMEKGVSIVNLRQAYEIYRPFLT